MKTISVQYFSMLRDQAGRDSEKRETSAANAQALYQELRTLYNFTHDGSSFRVAINDEFMPWETPINEGDKIVFIPPVAGG